ncbi:glycosyltransferase [Saccharolobus islandicus]|uniref:Glycosyltransferases involved in cell wall biogenesis n=1 Tax=Saccharolobus islandicus LAL14/1 TaxID=1241935 RepID=M9UCQ8_SACIS|nr:glycosyltransferase [Sulfolobus islandicus]AGJ62326.1 Glycosyltransferases involved in cell wall biogenesis [Sulfolobus islandicus LAL14/1]
MFSIQIPALHGKYLREVFESIRGQTFQDYEVVVVNSGGGVVTDLVREYGFKEVRKDVKLLEARYLANLESRGDYALLLDETRPLRRDALELLSKNLHDMVIIGERELGNSFWVKAAQLDKDNIMSCNSPEAIKGFALPRLFKRNLLTTALERLREGLGEKFSQVIFPDHELIYYEASLLSSDIFVFKEELIYHYGDVSLRDIIRKYYRYGKSLKVLKGTPYSFMTSISRKRREICKGGIYDRVALYMLYLARGIPFLLGELL